MDNLSPSRKQKELTELPTIAQYLKTLPINLPEELVNVINGLAPINETFKANLSTLTVYRANLGFEVEKNWINLLNYSRRLIWQLDIITKSNLLIIQGRKENTRIQWTLWPRRERRWMMRSENSGIGSTR